MLELRINLLFRYGERYESNAWMMKAVGRVLGC